MNRLDFLRKGAYTAATAVIGATSLSALLGMEGCSGATQKIIGLQLYSLREAMKDDVVATLKMVSEMGYKTIETAGYNDGKLYGYTPTDFKIMANDLGMSVDSAHISRSYNKEKDVEIMEWWRRAFSSQAEAGCRYVIQAHMPLGDSLDYIKEYSDYYNRVADIAKTEGVKFGFHNHAGEFEKREGEVILEYFLNNANDNMNFQLDVYWAMKGGVDPAQFIKKYGKKIPVLHIKDESIIGDSETLDFEKIFNAAYSVGIKDYFVEVERYSPLPPEGCVERSFDYLNSASFVR